MFLPFSVRKMITQALAYSYLRYGITIFSCCSLFWRARANSLLKGILKSVAFDKPDILLDTCIFCELQLPSFEGLFKETVVLRHFWNSMFKTPYLQPRPMRPSLRFDVPRIRTKYGERTRMYYVPHVFNNLPESSLSIKYKNKLKKALQNLDQ
ncbi:unnamed protein product [Ixodes persulcatus]